MFSNQSTWTKITARMEWGFSSPSTTLFPPTNDRFQNVAFVFSIEDMVNHPTQPIWTLSRLPQDHNLWLMPDFGFWSWDLQDLGALDDVVEQVTRLKASNEWVMKNQKLVGEAKPQMLPKLRRALLDASKDKSWSKLQGWFRDHHLYQKLHQCCKSV